MDQQQIVERLEAIHREIVTLLAEIDGGRHETLSEHLIAAFKQDGVTRQTPGGFVAGDSAR